MKLNIASLQPQIVIDINYYVDINPKANFLVAICDLAIFEVAQRYIETI